MNDVVACVGEIVPVQAVPMKPKANPTVAPKASPTPKPTPKPKPATAAPTTKSSEAVPSGAGSEAAGAASSAVDLASLTHATFHSKCVDGTIGARYAFLRAAVAEGGHGGMGSDAADR